MQARVRFIPSEIPSTHCWGERPTARAIPGDCKIRKKRSRPAAMSRAPTGTDVIKPGDLECKGL